MDPIKITEIEEKIFTLILNTCNYYNLNNHICAVGGWVRDKMMNTNSDDIDISIEGITGKKFVNLIKNYSPNIKSNIHIININPEKSKMLETASITLYGVSVDFVNFRTECYKNSRIPEMLFSSAKEDALRRDLTINSLFYNLRTKKIEDFTGVGILHLNNKLIATPLDPIITFTEDPLRLLRSIRFYCKFDDFKLDEKIINLLDDKNIISLLNTKVSSERVIEEFRKIFYYKKSLTLISKINFVNYLFPNNININFNFFENDSYIIHIKDKDYLFYSYFSIICMNVDDINTFCKQSKMTKEENNNLILISEASKLFGNYDRLSIGKAMRKANIFWEIALYVNLLRNNNEMHYEYFLSLINMLELELVWEWKYLLSGKDIINRYKLKQGILIGYIMKKQMEWMLKNYRKNSYNYTNDLIKFLDTLK